MIANSSLAHDEETTLAKKHGRDNSPGQLGVSVAAFSPPPRHLLIGPSVLSANQPRIVLFDF